MLPASRAHPPIGRKAFKRPITDDSSRLQQQKSCANEMAIAMRSAADPASMRGRPLLGRSAKSTVGSRRAPTGSGREPHSLGIWKPENLACWPPSPPSRSSPGFQVSRTRVLERQHARTSPARSAPCAVRFQPPLGSGLVRRNLAQAVEGDQVLAQMGLRQAPRVRNGLGARGSVGRREEKPLGIFGLRANS